MKRLLVVFCSLLVLTPVFAKIAEKGIVSGDAGTVTSVAATGDNGLSLTGSPITTTGTLAFTFNSTTPSFTTPTITTLKLSTGAVTNIVAANGITATATYMQIAGSGGAVDISANPQIAVGTNGQMLYLQGTSDTNTVRFDDGTGLKLNSASFFILGDNDTISFVFQSGIWIELSRNNVSGLAGQLDFSNYTNSGFLGIII